jgi:hypothetical protein
MPQSASAILWPMLAHIGWVFMLYAWITIARTRAVKQGEIDYSAFVLGREEPLPIARITRNLANQFELPVFFYVAAVLLIVLGKVTTFDIVAAWVFVAGRVAHTLVQTLTDNVGLRGKVFTINFLAVVALVGHLGLIAFEGTVR